MSNDFELINKAVSFYFKPYLRNWLNNLAKEKVSDDAYLSATNCPPACSFCCGKQGKNIEMYLKEFSELTPELLSKGLNIELKKCLVENKQNIIDSIYKETSNDFIEINYKIPKLCEGYNNLLAFDPKIIEAVAKKEGVSYENAKELIKGKPEDYFDLYQEKGIKSPIASMFIDEVNLISEKIGFKSLQYFSKLETLDELLTLKDSLGKLFDEARCSEVINVLDSVEKLNDEKLKKEYGARYNEAKSLLNACFNEFFKKTSDLYDKISNYENNNEKPSLNKVTDHLTNLSKAISINNPQLNEIVLYTINRLIIEDNPIIGKESENVYINKSSSFGSCPFYFGKCVIHDFKNYPKNCEGFFSCVKKKMTGAPLSVKKELYVKFVKEEFQLLLIKDSRNQAIKEWSDFLDNFLV